jgi:hypothetical protein
MNLNDIKGIIEINGESYDPKSVLKALIDQGLKIHPLNGSLLIGRTFVDATPNLKQETPTCPISEHCKIYDRLYHQNNAESSSSDYNLTQSPPSLISDAPESSSDRFYTDPVRIDLDDIDITDLFSDSSDRTSSIDRYEQNVNIEADFRHDLDSEPEDMIGLSPVTRYGRRISTIQESTIPTEHRGRCPYCNSVVSIKWRFCGSCGTPMD